MSFSKSTRHNSQHTKSRSTSSEFVIKRLNRGWSNSLTINNEDNENLDVFVVDENYLQYHKDRPTPDQIIERKIRMTENNMVL